MQLELSPMASDVLAVLVLYRRRPSEAQAWSFLCRNLGSYSALGVRLASTIIYDNSPCSADVKQCEIPRGMKYVADTSNGGTAAAYTAALAYASECRCSWILFLDQDTCIPEDYLRVAGNIIYNARAPTVLVPRVFHSGELVSPSHIRWTGVIRPSPLGEASRGIPTAISSGLIFHVDALSGLLPPPRVLWLDYLDHWIFLQLARRGIGAVSIDACIPHNLSVRDPSSITTERMQSILKAEKYFCRELGRVAAVMLPVRRLARALRYCLVDVRLARMILYSIVDGRT